MSQQILKSFLICTLQMIILYSVHISCVKDGIQTLEGKIVGGSDSKIKEFPHAVFLLMTCGAASQICGSSVVNQVILVTAAHCLQCKRKFQISAQAGHHDLRQVSVVRKVTKFVTHPRFSDATLVNDIALILLSKNLPLGNNIKRVIIKPTFPEETTGYVAGWGITDDETGNRPSILKKVKMDIPPANICSTIGYLRPGMMCAGTLKSTKNRPSRGDSGSALISIHHQQLGIVSFRNPPYIAMLVYTNVSYFYTWIKTTAKEMYCSEKEF